MSSLQSGLGHRRAGGSPRIGLFLVFWVMLWASLNTEPTTILDANSWLGIFHGLRAYLVFLAAYLAGLMVLTRHPRFRPLFRGPLGLITAYGLVGFISSLLLSPKPAIALYWAAAYLSVLVVLGSILLGANSLTRIRKVINLNWLIVGGLSLVLMVISWPLMFPGGLSLPGLGQLAQSGQRLPGQYILANNTEILGMPMVRSTGIGRYAAVLGIVAFCRLWNSRRPWRLVWILLLFFSLGMLFLFQARGAIIAFVAAIFLVLLLRLRRKAKVVIPLAALLLFATVWTFGFPDALGQYLMRGATPTRFFIEVGGRTAIWALGWEVFKGSPLLGFGFQADRFLVEGAQLMHNAFFEALIYTGLLGTVFFVGAFVSAWVTLIRVIRRRIRVPLVERLWLIETAGVLAFLTVLSISQSTGALYGVEWLLLAPLFAYIQILSRSKPE